MNLKQLKESLFKTKKEKAFYAKYDLAYEVKQMLLEARALKGMTQGELAKRAGTQQSNIARAESGRWLPSLSFLARLARAYRTELVPPRFEFMGNFGWSERVKDLQSEGNSTVNSFHQHEWKQEKTVAEFLNDKNISTVNKNISA